MKYNEIEIKENDETKEIKFRLTSSNCMMLEEKAKKSVIEYISEESITMVVTMLRYMRMWELPQFSKEDAQKLYDLLIDNGWTYKKIVRDIIYETLVSSGFLDQAEWEEIKKQSQQATTRLKEKQADLLENI